MKEHEIETLNEYIKTLENELKIIDPKDLNFHPDLSIYESCISILNLLKSINLTSINNIIMKERIFSRIDYVDQRISYLKDRIKRNLIK